MRGAEAVKDRSPLGFEPDGELLLLHAAWRMVELWRQATLIRLHYAPPAPVKLS